MFVVRTIPQLEEAIRARAREVFVIGKLAPELLEIAAQPTENIKRARKREGALKIKGLRGLVKQMFALCDPERIFDLA